MFKEDDRDVKIFSFEAETDNSERETLEEIEKQHKNGNILLAKKLGEMFADELLPSSSMSQFGFAGSSQMPPESIEISFQRRVLMAFCVEIGLDIYIPNSIVSSAAVSEFHKRMENEYHDFYKRVMDMGAFSLYYLSLRTEEKVEKAIGTVFAGLCGESGKKLYSDFGEALFIYFMDAIEKAVNDIGFVELVAEKEKSSELTSERRN